MNEAQKPAHEADSGGQSEEKAGMSLPLGEEAEAASPQETGAAVGQPEQGAGAGQTEGTETPAEEDAAHPAAAPPTLEETIADLEAKLSETHNNYLRKAAEMENYRKRMLAEKQSAIDYANQAILLDLASVIDDFERAIKAAEVQRENAGAESEKIIASYNSLYEGIIMIEKNLIAQLENKWGLKRFNSEGEPFDPNKHEAIMMETSAELEEAVVAEDFIKGYFLKDRVLRPAKVKVVMPEKQQQ